MSGEWDADEGIEEPTVAVESKWEGEDDDDNVKDNWFDEDEEQVIPTEETNIPEPIFPKRKTNLDKGEEKEFEEDFDKKELTLEEQLKKKLRIQMIQEEADLELARETFGDCQSESSVSLGDALVSKKDFDEFREKLVEKLKNSKNSVFFIHFMEDLLRDICLDYDIKKLSNLITVVHNEKLKQSKTTKGRKKKAKVYMGKETDIEQLNVALDDYTDFF